MGDVSREAKQGQLMGAIYAMMKTSVLLCEVGTQKQIWYCGVDCQRASVEPWVEDKSGSWSPQVRDDASEHTGFILLD